MSQPNFSEITFPEDLPPKKKQVQIPPALKFITSLLYKSGTALSLLYIVLIFIIQPLLEVQYSRRLELSSFVLKRARNLLITLSKTQRLPTVAIKKGSKLYSDAQVQTIDESELLIKPHNHTDFRKCVSTISFEDEQIASKNLIQERLIVLKETLDDNTKFNIAISQVNPLNFQIKKFQGSIDAYNHAQLFKAGRAMSGHSTGIDIKNDIRTIKGWYLRGEV